MQCFDRIVNPNQSSGLLFLHGFVGDNKEFKEIGRAFEKSHSVIYAQLPGHRHRPIEESCNFMSTAQSYVAMLQAQNTRKWHIVGYSLGGRLALYIALRCPNIVKRLTLISASPGLEFESQRRERSLADEQLAKMIERLSPRSFLTFWYRKELFKSFKNSQMFWPTFKRRQDYSPFYLSHALRAMTVARQPSLWGALPELQMPVRLICGAMDRKFCDIALRMKNKNPLIVTTVVEEVGHVVHLENGRLVRQWLSKDEF